MKLRKVNEVLYRTLISVYDKTGVVDFAKFLVEKEYEILSTGGTARLLEEHKIKVKKISEYTNFEEIMDGRVKTLHPKIYAGILADRDNDDHRHEIQKLEYDFIDIVVVNLYPFKEVISKPGVTMDEAVENIDIGGVTLIRAAAKNFKHVVVVTEPDDYKLIIENLNKYGEIDLKMRKELAVKAFKVTKEYDDTISNHFAGLKIR